MSTLLGPDMSSDALDDWERVCRGAHGPVVMPRGVVLALVQAARERGRLRAALEEANASRENILRGVGASACNAAKTHCSNGHPFDEENTGFGKRGNRVCRECARQRNRRYSARLREEFDA